MELVVTRMHDHGASTLKPTFIFPWHYRVAQQPVRLAVPGAGGSDLQLPESRDNETSHVNKIC